MKFWKKPPTVREIRTEQERLRSLSGDVLERYRRELDAEISDPSRLASVYGKPFANSDARRQAEVVAKMATQMLNVPNAEVNVLTIDEQENIAAVHDREFMYGKQPVPMCESYCKNVISTGRELSIDNASEHPLVCDTQIAREGVVVSYLGVPVANRHGMVIGVLCVYESVEREWQPADVGMLTQLSMVLTRALS